VRRRTEMGAFEDNECEEEFGLMETTSEENNRINMDWSGGLV